MYRGSALRALVRAAALVSFVGGALSACHGGDARGGRPVTPDLTIPPMPVPPAAAADGSCTTSAAKVVASLRSPLRITAYVTTGHPKLKAFVERIRAVLDELRAAGAGVNVAVVDTSDPAQAEKAKEAGLQEFRFAEADTDVMSGYFGIVVEYGAEREAIKVLTPDLERGLMFWVQSKIVEVRRRAERSPISIGILTGHGEPTLAETTLVPSDKGKPSLRGIIEQYFPFYRFVDVDTKNGAVAIDTSLSGLLVLQPERDLVDQELARIDDFVLAGKRLAVVASAVNVRASDPLMHATLSTHGLEKLLTGYGIEMRRDVIEDFGRAFKVEVMTTTSSSPLTMRFPPILDVRDEQRATGDQQLLDTGFACFFKISQIPFPFASSLVLHPERQPDLGPGGLRVLARSTPTAARETSTDVSLGPLRRWMPKDKDLGQYAVAAVASGKLRSAFPPKTSKSSRASRVLVISSSQFFTNPFARAATPSDDTMTALTMPYAQQVLTNTILVAKNTLDWMGMDEDLEACQALH